MTTSQLRPFILAFYGIGAVMILIALGDFTSNVWPFRPTAVDWRYGSIGIFSNFLVTPTFGLLLLAVGAAAGGHRAVLRVLGIVAITIAAGLLAAIALFALDYLQVRQQANEGAKWFTAVGATMASVKYLLVAAVLFLLGLGSLRGGREAAAARGKGRGAGLVVNPS